MKDGPGFLDNSRISNVILYSYYESEISSGFQENGDRTNQILERTPDLINLKFSNLR
jgi:hypothetical protein